MQTSRLAVHIAESGPKESQPLILLHGNFSSSVYFEPLMMMLPSNLHCIAVDLRGYGLTEDFVIDATRGARDWVDDLLALFEARNIDAAHLLGWSLGAAVAMQFTLDYPEMVKGLALVAPISPFGFGGTKDIEGTPCYADFAGSGGGLVDANFVEGLNTQGMDVLNPFSPRNLVPQSYANTPFKMPFEEELLGTSITQHYGERRYPGDMVSSTNWPYTAPGRWGPLNAVSAKYFDASAIADLECKPPILWLHGDMDLVVSDRSMHDAGVLGEMQLIPGWPGKDVYPAQPMVSQMRYVLDRYRQNGGSETEVQLVHVGHIPFVEAPDRFRRSLLQFLLDTNLESGDP